MILITEETYHQLDNEMEGVCIECHGVNGCCEPDARYYPCDFCQKNKVFGISELLVMGAVELVDDASEENIKY